jgi:predicted SAM-dependent methyltransferase
MTKLNNLNIGCGNKFHPDWHNADYNPVSDQVSFVDIKKSLPYSDNSFDVIYHSQVLEHLTRIEGEYFISECFRILKPGGIIRIVVPDLENIVKEYLSQLKLNKENPTSENFKNYTWILLELFDQVSRNKSLGEMGEFLSSKEKINPDYVISRIGNTARSFIEKSKPLKKKQTFYTLFRQRISKIKSRIKSLLSCEALEIGSFRKSGEVHYWMYDSFSLGKLLEDVGFNKIQSLDPFSSNIPKWNSFELDLKNGNVIDPNSVFVEAFKND